MPWIGSVWLTNSGLGYYFEASVSPVRQESESQCQRRLPTLCRNAADPNDVVIVGDSWDRDVAGALSAGLSAVWIASGRPAPERLEGVTVIDSIGELMNAFPST